MGPRPALPKEVAKYDDYQRQRLLVKPGITCYWQTRMNRDSITFDEWVDLDLIIRLSQGYVVGDLQELALAEHVGVPVVLKVCSTVDHGCSLRSVCFLSRHSRRSSVVLLGTLAF